MHSRSQTDRRRLLVAGAGALVGLPTLAVAAEKPGIDPEEGVTAPEDLMKEHGVLNRCLLLYEEGMRRLRAGEDAPPEVFQHVGMLVRQFVEQYHEKNEENFIFPVFKRAGRLTGLVETLLTQHKAGRRLTARILRLSQGDAYGDPQNRKRLVANCAAFIRMYRPHEAREDTVLFPALRTILPAAQVLELGERMEEFEQKALGHEGFERSVAQVEALEKQLGIHDLKQFTP